MLAGAVTRDRNTDTEVFGRLSDDHRVTKKGNQSWHPRQKCLQPSISHSRRRARSEARLAFFPHRGIARQSRCRARNQPGRRGDANNACCQHVGYRVRQCRWRHGTALHWRNMRHPCQSVPATYSGANAPISGSCFRRLPCPVRQHASAIDRPRKIRRGRLTHRAQAKNIREGKKEKGLPTRAGNPFDLLRKC